MTHPDPGGNVWGPPTGSGDAYGSAESGTPEFGAPEFGAPESGSPGFDGPPALPRSHRRQGAFSLLSGDVLAAVLSAVLLVVAGVPFGLLWGLTAPKVDVGALLRNNEAVLTAPAAADARFALLAVVFGLVGGLVAGWRGRRSGWALPAGLLLGGLGGSLVAAQVGHLLESRRVLAAVPARANAELLRGIVDFSLRAEVLHVVYPLAALVAFLLVVVTTTRPEPLSVPETPPADAWWSAPR